MSDSQIRYLDDSTLFVRIDYNDIINFPSYYNDLGSCISCSNIQAISGATLEISGSLQLLNDQVYLLQNQLNSSAIGNINDQLATKVNIGTFNNHHHDTRYYTKNQLKNPSMGAEVNWNNLTSVTPSISAVSLGNITMDIVDALSNSTQVVSSPPSSGNPFITRDYVEDKLGTIGNALHGHALFDLEYPVSPATYRNYSRQTSDTYDIYYADQGIKQPHDWSFLKYHLEYLVHRKNPASILPALYDGEENWVDEDVDGNKIWRGNRHIFTGGAEGYLYSRALEVSDVTGIAATADLYNEETNKEEGFKNRQVILYGGMTLGYNLTVGGNIVAPDASVTIHSLETDSDINILDGSLTLHGNSQSITISSGNLHVGGTGFFAGQVELKDRLIIDNNVLLVDLVNLHGSQSSLTFNGFSVNNGNLSVSGSINSIDDIVTQGDGFFGGSLNSSSTLSVLSNASIGGKITVGGTGLASTFGSSVVSNGHGWFYNGNTVNNIPSNTAGYFGGNVIVSGGVTVGTYMDFSNDIIGRTDLYNYGNSYLVFNNGSSAIFGDPSLSNNEGEIYINKWSSNQNKVSSFISFTRKFATSSNIITLRYKEDNVLGSGNSFGPTEKQSTNQINISSIAPANNTGNWNKIDINDGTTRRFRNDYEWAGFEVKSNLSQIDSSFSDSQYLLFTSNFRGYSQGTGVYADYGTSESLNFGWIFNDWFSRPDEATASPIKKFPLHLIASKDYVDFRLDRLKYSDSIFKVSVQNMAQDGATNNQTIIWSQSQGKWIVSDPSSSFNLYESHVYPVQGSFSIVPTIVTTFNKNILLILTDKDQEGSFSVTLPHVTADLIGKEIVIKFLNNKTTNYPLEIRASGGSTIDEVDSFIVASPTTGLRFIAYTEGHWGII
jgi:hypothetical protein